MAMTDVRPHRATPARDNEGVLRGFPVVVNIHSEKRFYRGFVAWSEAFIDPHYRLMVWVVPEKQWWCWCYTGRVPADQRAYPVDDVWVEARFETYE